MTIDVLTPSKDGIEIVVTDDGAGMSARHMQQALAFGGTTRFGDRSSLGRFGMGLPNGVLSQARRAELYSWRGRQVLWTYLDFDEVVQGTYVTIPSPKRVVPPDFVGKSPQGSAVRLLKCDRLDYRRRSSLLTRLEHDLGRIYRHFIGTRLKLTLNGKKIPPYDPLCIQKNAVVNGGRLFGDALRYQLTSISGAPGEVVVRFAELPVEDWHGLTNSEKQKLGLTRSSPVSIVRAGREIDHGWYFMGSKRRENYDDWWRCEIAFDPTLDEFFGITNSKQRIVPRQALIETLASDIEQVARALNSRVRRRFEMLKVHTSLREAERRAASADRSLPRLPPVRRREATAYESLLDDLGRQDAPYLVRVAELTDAIAFDFVRRDNQLCLLLNSRHPIFRDLLGPLASSDLDRDQKWATLLTMLVLATARAEASAANEATRRTLLRDQRRLWSDVSAAFYNAV